MLVKWYESQLLSAKRRQFGSTSEKAHIDAAQLSLFGETDTPALPAPENEEAICKRKKRKGKRCGDLSGLPAERIDYELPESERACPDCGNIMRDIGVQKRRELKLIPAKVVVLDTWRTPMRAGTALNMENGRLSQRRRLRRRSSTVRWRRRRWWRISRHRSIAAACRYTGLKRASVMME